MVAKTLGVGIIGASAERGWAKESHVPAVRNLAGLELAAVGASNQSTAEAAAKAFGAKHAYGRAEDLINDPGVDVVAIAVKVPDHRELVLAALKKGKHVYCEWPLGRDLAEAEIMLEAAKSAGVHTAIGLQARMSPPAQQACVQMRSGAIGRVLSARMYSSTIAFASKIGKGDLYLESAANGATLISIHGGHALDLAVLTLGALKNISALASIQFPEIEVGDEAATRTRTVPDHLLVQARIANGGAVSIEVAGARPAAETRFRLEVVGDKGDLVLDGGAPRGFQSGRLRLSLNGESQHLDDGETESMPDAAANVAAMYAQLRDDILEDTWTVPGFDHAVRLTKLCDDVVLSSQTGSRKQAAGWPE